MLSLHQAGTYEKASSALSIKLGAANPHAKIEGLDQLPGKSNYFIGKNPRNWHTDVSTFGRVYYHEIYQGIDLVYYGNQRQLENDFVVSPGADASTIALAFDGAQKIAIDKDGNLLLQIGVGQVQLQRPVIYQLADGIRQEVSGNYVLKSSGDVGFEVAATTTVGRLLSIQSWSIPAISVATAPKLATRSMWTMPAALTLPAIPRRQSFHSQSNRSNAGGTTDAFIVKINPAGSAIVYSTYLGGSSTDVGIDISVDGSQNAYITGRTASNDFPTMNAFDNAYSGGTVEDAFVVRVNAAGSALVYSTYLSGNFARVVVDRSQQLRASPM